MAPDWLTTSRFVLGAAATITYLAVGLVIGHRRTSKDALLSLRAFQAFWFGLAILTLLGPLLFFLDTFAIGGLGLRIFILEVALILIVLAIGGLLYYLGYVYSGKKWLVWPVGIYTVLEIAFLLTVISQAHITGYSETCPGRFCYETELKDSPASLALSLSLFVPILLGVVGYFALYFRVTERAPKRRILLVATGLGLWFGSSFVASFVQGVFETSTGTTYTTLNQARIWTDFAGPAIGLAASLLILYAYLRPLEGSPSSTPDPNGPATYPKIGEPGSGRRLSSYPALT